MGAFTETFADDEDCAQRIPSDYSLIVPDTDNRASGTDGVITAAAPWDLTSATADFEARGVEVGHVVQLKFKVGQQNVNRLFAVESASGNALTLRRIGSAAGEGQPAGPATGSYVGIHFDVYSFRSQLLNATRWIRQHLRLLDITTEQIAAAGLDEIVENACAYRAIALECYDKATEGSAAQGGASVASRSPYWSKGDKYQAFADKDIKEIRTTFSGDGEDLTEENIIVA